MAKILKESVVARIRDAESKIHQLLVKHRVVGLGCGLVLDQDLVWSKGFGLTDLENPNSVPDENTVFRCGSITKTFTAAAIVRLYDQGKLSLDDPIFSYIPEFRAVKVNRGSLEEVTLRRLLTHRSGLMCEAPLDHWTTFKFPTAEDLVGALRNVAVVLKPDSQFKYSNLGYSLLGEVVARVSGVPYREFVREEILKPLAMNATGFELTGAMRSRAAVGYLQNTNFSDQLTAVPTIELNGMSAAGQLYSSVADLGRWLAFQIRAGRSDADHVQVLSNDALEEMHRVHYVDSGWQWGECLSWRATRHGDEIYHRHGGGIHGFISLITFNKRHRFGVIVATNCWQFNAREEITWFICDEIMPLIRTEGTPKSIARVAPVPENLKRFLGRYQTRNAPDAGYLEVVWQDGSLACSPPPVAKLVPSEDPNVFFTEVGREPVVFECDDNGSVVRIRNCGAVFSRVELRSMN